MTARGTRRGKQLPSPSEWTDPMPAAPGPSTLGLGRSRPGLGCGTVCGHSGAVLRVPGVRLSGQRSVGNCWRFAHRDRVGKLCLVDAY